MTTTETPLQAPVSFRLRVPSAVVLALATAVGAVAFSWPFLAPPPTTSPASAHSADAPWIFLALLPCLLAVVLSELVEGKLDSKAIAVLGVLAACGAALRLPGGIAPGFEPLFFLLIPAGRVLGRGFGFVLGALTLFASALLTGGVGPWLPFQMLGAAWVGFFAGCLPPARGKVELALLAAYAVVASLAYGIAMNLWFWPFGASGPTTVSFVPGDAVADNLGRFVAFHLATSLGFDIPRAVTTLVLVLTLGPPVIAALRRAARRAAFGSMPSFAESPTDARH